MLPPALFIRCLRFVFAEFLEARIIPERIEHRIEPEQRRSERYVSSQRPHTVSRVASAERRWRGRALPYAPRPGRRISIEMGPVKASFSSGFAAIARSDRANAAALSPRPILIRARSSRRESIFWLFFKKRFKLAARLSPTFVGGDMVAGDFLRPT